MKKTLIAINKLEDSRENITPGREYEVVTILDNMVSVVDNFGYKINFYKKKGSVYLINSGRGLFGLEDYFSNVDWLYHGGNVEKIVI